MNDVRPDFRVEPKNQLPEGNVVVTSTTAYDEDRLDIKTMTELQTIGS